MGLGHSPRIVTDGLVLCLDAANTKGYDKFENLRTNSNTGGFFPVVGSYTSTGTSTDILAPDGSNTTYKVVANGTQQSTIDIAYLQITLTAGQTYTVSVYYYATGSTTSSRNLGIQVFGNGSAFTTFTPPQNTWVRQSLTFTASSTSNTGQIRVISNDYASFNSQSGATVYLWGAQLERGSSVTDYYATTSTAKTRGSTLIDLSGRGNNGTLTNGPTYNSSNGGSIVFDGADDYITVSNVQPNTNNFTISVWVYKFNNTSNDYIWDFGSNGGTLSAGTNVSGYGFRYYNATLGTSSNMYTQGTIPDINKWYNVTITRNSGTSIMYVNGSLITSSPGDTYDISSTTLYIGRYGGGTGYEHHGYISNFNIYNKALTAAEVQQNFNALRGRFGI